MAPWHPKGYRTGSTGAVGLQKDSMSLRLGVLARLPNELIMMLEDRWVFAT